MEKIIFLDVDGVLNSFKFFEKNKEPKNYTTTLDDNELDYQAVRVLNKIIKKTNAKVVVSSTWRLNHYEELIQRLNRLGFKGEIIDKTPKDSCWECVRGNMILAWIKNNQKLLGYNNYHDFKNYVILDDDSDMLYWQKDNFVHVKNDKGLTNKYVGKAVRILNIGVNH